MNTVISSCVVMQLRKLEKSTTNVSLQDVQRIYVSRIYHAVNVRLVHQLLQLSIYNSGHYLTF